jgi:hypothetical protein
VLDWHRGIRTALAEVGARHGVERDWTGITNAYRRRALQRMTNQVNPGFNIDDMMFIAQCWMNLRASIDLICSWTPSAPPSPDLGIR